MAKLYDAVDRHKGERRERGGSLRAPLLIALALLIVAAFPVVSAVRGEHRFQRYMSALTESDLYARENGSLTAALGGEEHLLDSDALGRIYGVIFAAGKGNAVRETPEEPGLLLTFGDGSTLELWYRDVQGARLYRDGSLLRYTDAHGWRYQYETKLVRYSHMKQYAGW